MSEISNADILAMAANLYECTADTVHDSCIMNSATQMLRTLAAERQVANDVTEKTTLSSTIQFTEDGVQQITDICGEITKSFANLRVAQFDKAIREKLIALGWTPPNP